MNRRIARLLSLGLLLAAALGATVLAQVSANFDLSWHLLSGGGGTRSSASYRLDDALGQWPQRPSSSAHYGIEPGFWTRLSARGVRRVYLPLVLRSVPPPAPALQPIANGDGDGAYTVAWSTAEGATAYQLEEAKERGCANWSQIYAGADLSHEVSGRGAARYCYRVQARNASGASAWSNIRQVDVLVEAEPNNEPAACNGPLVSGLTYQGALPAGEGTDYYCLTLPAAHTIEVRLTHIPAGQDFDLALRDQTIEPALAVSNRSGSHDEEILTATLPAGRYYIQVYQLGQTGSDQQYHLQAVYE